MACKAYLDGELVVFDHLACTWCGHTWKPRRLFIDDLQCPRCKHKIFWHIEGLVEEEEA